MDGFEIQSCPSVFCRKFSTLDLLYTESCPSVFCGKFSTLDLLVSEGCRVVRLFSVEISNC
jgi:hypothetical protein